jgi:hypothetical protein
VGKQTYRKKSFLSAQIGFKAYRNCWDPQQLEMYKRTMTAIIFLSITTLQIITIGLAVRTSVGLLAVLTGFLVTFHRVLQADVIKLPEIRSRPVSFTFLSTHFK